MKEGTTHRRKLAAEVAKLSDRIAAAEADSARVAGNRITTQRRLAELGEQVARLKRDLADVADRNAAERR
jgi:hypothetical protein